MNKLYEYGVRECVKSIRGVLSNELVDAVEKFLINKKSRVLVLDRISEKEKDTIFERDLWRVLTDSSSDGKEHYKDYALGYYYDYELYRREYDNFSGVEIFGLYKFLKSKTKGVNVEDKLNEIKKLYTPSERLVVNISFVDVTYNEVLYFIDMMAQRFDVRMTVEKNEDVDLIKGKYVYKLEITRNINDLCGTQKVFKENSRILHIHADILNRLKQEVYNALTFNMEDLEVGSEVVYNVISISENDRKFADEKFLTYESLSDLLRFILRRYTKPDSIDLDISVDEKHTRVDLHLTKIS